MDLTKGEIESIAVQAAEAAINGNKQDSPHLSWFLTKPGIVIAGLLIAFGSWKAVSEYKQIQTDKFISTHVSKDSHLRAGKDITRLQTQFTYIEKQLTEIKMLIRRQSAAK